MKKKQSLPATININAIESRLPRKKKRSHHEIVMMRKVSKEFYVGKQKIKVLKGISLTLYSGEFVIVYGPSGCGKSTFLHTVLGLEKPTRGEVFIRGKDIYDMTSDDRTCFRREKIGMVFQKTNWIKSLSVLENVAYPLYLSGIRKKEALDRAYQQLQTVGMESLSDHRTSELSGGQEQRIALARALTADPWIIIADEPTGNLDTKASENIIELLARLNREKRRMVIMVTHEMHFLPIASRRVSMKDGEVIYDEHD